MADSDMSIEDKILQALEGKVVVVRSDAELGRALGLRVSGEDGPSNTQIKRAKGRLVRDGRVAYARRAPDGPGDWDRPIHYRLIANAQ